MAGLVDSGGGDGGEPRVSDAPAPVGLFVVFGVLVFLSMLYLDGRAGGFHPRVYEPFVSWDRVRAVQPRRDVDPRFERGRGAYQVYCSACHQSDGRGVPGSFPPLAGSDWVLAGGPDRIIRLVLDGLAGPITVSGVEWVSAAQMPPWKETIVDDEELACLITYIRGEGEWGNDAGAVSAERVGVLRAESEGRGVPWTQDELFGMPEG